MEALVTKEAPLTRLAGNLSVRLFILALRAAAPAAFLLTCWNSARLIRTPGALTVRRLLWNALSTWSVVEVAFLFYILEYRRRLNAQTTRRWQSVTTHSTEEKRRSSMERYLLALTQVCKAGPSEDVRSGSKKVNGVRTLAVQSAQTKLGLLNRSDRRHNSNPEAEQGSFLGSKLRQFSSSNLVRMSSGNLFGMPNRETSVDDVLKLWEGSDQMPDTDVQRLKWVELASFFEGPGRGDAEEIESWLCRGNVQEWIAHYWFRGATPQELKALRPKEYEELKRLVHMVLENAGLPHLPDGRNPRVRCFRIMTDPLLVENRPLAVYLGTSLLCPLLTSQVMVRLGFRRERMGGLSYWHRQPRTLVPGDQDIAGPRQTPLVFVHGLGVGLVPYYLFIRRLSRRHSAHLYVPELPFLAMAPWESVPSAREVVAQMQDMLAANGHTCAHFVGHSFGAVVVSWMMKMSPSSVVYATLMDPAQFLVMKADVLNKVLKGMPKTPFEMLIRFFAFRELFTVNLLCRNFFWEQSNMWPEDIHVPVVIELAGDDHIVASIFVRRLLEHERASRQQRRKFARRLSQQRTGSSLELRADPLQPLQRGQHTQPIDIQWCEGFFHGEILAHHYAQEKLFSKMRQMVADSQADVAGGPGMGGS